MRYIFNYLIIGVVFIVFGCKKEEGLKPLISFPPVLVSDFDTLNIYTFGNPRPSTGKYWLSDYRIPTNNPAPPADTIPQPDGNAFMYFNNSISAGNPYINYMVLLAADRDYGKTTDVKFPLYADPTRVYFNVYLYNTSAADTSAASITFEFTESNQSKRTFAVKNPTWDGWKLFSVRYSDLTLSTGTVGSGSPSNLVSVGIVLLSTQTNLQNVSKKVSIAVDHPIFTFDAPYQVQPTQ